MRRSLCLLFPSTDVECEVLIRRLRDLPVTDDYDVVIYCRATGIERNLFFQPNVAGLNIPDGWWWLDSNFEDGVQLSMIGVGKDAFDLDNYQPKIPVMFRGTYQHICSMDRSLLTCTRIFDFRWTRLYQDNSHILDPNLAPNFK